VQRGVLVKAKTRNVQYSTLPAASVLRRFFSLVVCGLSVFAMHKSEARAEPASDHTPIHIPMVIQQNPKFGTSKVSVRVGIGNLPPLPVIFDTGSSGLHVYADANLDAPGSGVRCTQTPTKVTYGNPPRIILSGVVCYADQCQRSGFSQSRRDV